MNCNLGGRISTPSRQATLCLTDKLPLQQQQQLQQLQHQQHHQQQQPLPAQPSNVGHQHRGDDGSSGYGSPDSETFETPQAQ